MLGYCHTHDRSFEFVCPECPPLGRVAKAAEDQWTKNQVTQDEYPHLSPLADEKELVIPLDRLTGGLDIPEKYPAPMIVNPIESKKCGVCGFKIPIGLVFYNGPNGTYLCQKCFDARITARTEIRLPVIDDEGRLPGFFPDGNIHPSAIVSQNCRWRYPNIVKVGAHSVVDDFGYFSTQLTVGRGCHIGAGVNISGGPKHKVVISDHSSVTYHSDIVCGSPDYTRQIVTIEGYGEDQEGGDVIFEPFTGAAAQTLIFWNNHIPEGTVILARGIVRPNFPFDPWTVYGMDPMKPWDLKKVMPRDRDAVMRQAERAEKWIQGRDKSS